MQPNPPHTDMAHPYTMLWPYLHTVPPLTHSTDISMFHTAFASQLGTHYNDIDSAFPAEQYVSNITFQQQKQQQLQNHHNHQQQLHRQNNKLLQHHKSRDLNLQKLGYEFNPTLSTPHFIYSRPPLDNENSISKKKKSYITNDKDNENLSAAQTPKKGHSFTIDFILNKDNKYGIDDEAKSPGNTSASACNSSELSDRRSCSPPEPTSPSPLGAPSSPAPSFLPVLHSTPNVFHSERFSSRHNRITEVCHPYFHKQFEYYSNPQTHPTFQQQQPISFEQQQQQQVSHHHTHQHQHESSHRNSFGPSSTNSSTTSFSSSSPPESMTSPGNETKESKLSNKTKRIRTIFTPEQLERLEAEFDRQQYMVGTERFYLASSLNLTEAQVKVWFQNRRIKWRKQHLEQQQARLAQGDLYRDLDDSDDSDHEDEAMTSVMSSSQDEGMANQSSFDNSIEERN